MSWAVVDRVFKTTISEGAAANAIMLSLANHCDDDGGSCFPGQDTIQIETGLSLDTIQRVLPILETGGWIKRKKRPGARGQWPSWTYQINLGKLIDRAAPCGSVDQAAPRGLDKNDQAAPRGSTGPHHAASPGRKVRLEPVIEPIIEPSRARETDDGGPRQRGGALGPPRQTGKRLGNGSGAAAEPSRDPSLVALEADIRQKLGERAEWLTEARLVACNADAVKFAVLNIHQADNIRRLCRRTILETTGAGELEFDVGPGAAKGRGTR
jgi:hypothetical protein